MNPADAKPGDVYQDRHGCAWVRQDQATGNVWRVVDLEEAREATYAAANMVSLRRLVPETAAALPEPETANPTHLRWAANIVEGWYGYSHGEVSADTLRLSADQLEAERAEVAEREAEDLRRRRLTQQVAMALSMSDGYPKGHGPAEGYLDNARALLDRFTITAKETDQ